MISARMLLLNGKHPTGMVKLRGDMVTFSHNYEACSAGQGV